MTFTHLLAEMSKAVPPLQAVHDLSEPESVTSDMHETHFAAAASQAMDTGLTLPLSTGGSLMRGLAHKIPPNRIRSTG